MIFSLSSRILRTVDPVCPAKFGWNFGFKGAGLGFSSGCGSAGGLAGPHACAAAPVRALARLPVPCCCVCVLVVWGSGVLVCVFVCVCVCLWVGVGVCVCACPTFVCAGSLFCELLCIWRCAS